MSFRLTDKGEDAATNPHARQGADLKVVGFMYAMKRPVEVEEIMDEIQLSDELTANVIRRLVNESYIEEL